MTINLQKPDITELKPRITVFGVGGGGGNAVNNMITAGLRGVEFVVANTDAQALTMSKADRLIQLGAHVTEGLGAGSQPEVGRGAAAPAPVLLRSLPAPRAKRASSPSASSPSRSTSKASAA